jgi:hypothetical protein
MPAERVAMRQVREIIRSKFSAGISTREIARQLGIIAASTVRETLRRIEGAGLAWPLPDSMSDGDLKAALYANHGTKRGHAATPSRIGRRFMPGRNSANTPHIWMPAHLEHCAARRRAAVQRLLMQVEIASECLDRRKKIGRRNQYLLTWSPSSS